MEEIKKVGLIIDDCSQSRQIVDLIRMSNQSNCFKISHLIVQKRRKINEPFIKSALAKVLFYFKRYSIFEIISRTTFKLIIVFEKFVVKNISNYRSSFDLVELSELKLPIIDVFPKISKYLFAGIPTKGLNVDILFFENFSFFSIFRIEKIDLL